MASRSDSSKASRVSKEIIIPEKGCGSLNPEGKFHYNRSKMIDEFVKFLNVVNLPLNTCESDCYEKFVQMTLQPAFKKVPLKQLIRKIVALYHSDKRLLRDYFVNFNGHVAVTADLWTSEWGERFVCVTCHWIDGSWIKQNRVIGFRIISDDVTSVDICGEIVNVLDEFKLRDKMFGISLGKSLDTNECVGYLTNELKPVLRELFVYDRSCAYVTNLCAQHGMEQLGLLINPIRELIRWTRMSSRGYGRVFEHMCKEVGMERIFFPLDCGTSWRSTYEMLSIVFPYSEIVTKLYKDNNVGEFDFQWDSIYSIIRLFGAFDSAINTFSSVDESSCHLVVQECIHIAHELKAYENDPLLSLVVRSMRNKWVEHLSDVPAIYCIGAILDPRVKIEGLSRLLEYYHETLGTTFCIEEKITGCRDILYRLHTHYASQKTTLKKGDEIMNYPYYGSELIMHILKKKKIDGQGKITELENYLLLEHVIPRDFDIFLWWKTKEEVFPVLSKVARDVLGTPVSIVALESVFSTGGGERVLDEQWLMLQPNEIQACICKRDWDRAEERGQHYYPTIDIDEPYLDTSDSEAE